MRKARHVIRYIGSEQSKIFMQGGKTLSMSRTKLLILFLVVTIMTIPVGTLLAQTSVAKGTAIISDANASSDRVTVALTGMGALADGQAYEGWLVSDDGSATVSLGVMVVDSAGAISHTYTSPGGDNLLLSYNKFAVTTESGGEYAIIDEIPIGSMEHIRHLLIDDGSGSGIIPTLQGQISLASSQATTAKASANLADLKSNLQKVVDTISNDGGLISTARKRNHATLATSDAGDVSVAMKAAANLVEQYGVNVETWATEALAAAETIDGTTDLDVAKVLMNQVIGALDAAANGIGTDGGAAQAYVQAQVMATYQVPGRPVYVAPTPTPVPTATPVPPVEEPELPVVGDTSVAKVAQIGLLASLLLLTSGGFILLRSRRSSGNS